MSGIFFIKYIPNIAMQDYNVKLETGTKMPKNGRLLDVFGLSMAC